MGILLLTSARADFPVCNCISNEAFSQMSWTNPWSTIERGALPFPCVHSCSHPYKNSTNCMALQSGQINKLTWQKGNSTKKKKKKVIIFTFLVRSACCMTVSAKARDGCEHLVRGSSKSRPVASVTAWSQHSLGGPSRNNLQMYWTTSFTDKSTQLDDYKGLDLNQLTIWPIIASLPMKMNILGSCPVRMKYILTTNHFYFQKSLIKKMNS